jgi:hypothetical protein
MRLVDSAKRNARLEQHAPIVMSSREMVHAVLNAQSMSLRTSTTKNAKLFHAPMSRPTKLLREMVYVPLSARITTKRLMVNAKLRLQLIALILQNSFILMENAMLHAQNFMKILAVTKNALFSLKIALVKWENS